jgi:hypothetical protein
MIRMLDFFGNYFSPCHEGKLLYSTVHMSRISMDLNNNEVGELVPYPKAKVKSIAWKHFKFKKDKNG